MSALLEIQSLSVEFGSPDSPVRALRDVSLQIHAGETVGLIGESGSGKSLTTLAAIRLLPRGARVTAGTVRVEGRSLDELSAGALRRLRGGRIGLIFQEPMTALNPVRRIADQFTDVYVAHLGTSRRTALTRAHALLEALEVADTPRVLHSYPLQLSGGTRQRVLVALAMACEPALLIADEITTAVDALARTEMLGLLRRAVTERNASVLLVTHDVETMARLCQRALIMYQGEIVEEGGVASILRAPTHPYTRMLLGARPGSVPRKTRLATASGRGLTPQSTGCRFLPRCAMARAQCHEPQPLRPLADGHKVRCNLTERPE